MAARARRSDDRWDADRHRSRRGTRAETNIPGHGGAYGGDRGRDRGRGGQSGHAGHSHGHSHGHGPAAPASRRLRVIMTSLLAPLGAVAVIGMILLWPATPHPQSDSGHRVWVAGTVTASQIVGPTGTPAAGPTPATGTSGAQDSSTNQLTIRITSGPTKGATVQQTVGIDNATPKFAAGDPVTLTYDSTAPAESQYELKDFQRGPPLASLAIAFALFVVVVGRWRGIGAIVALAASFALLVKFTLPAIIDGENAVEVAAVSAGVILFAALYATHGLSVRTSVAVLGTGISLGLIGGLGWAYERLGHVTGLGDDNAITTAALFGKVDVHGLLLAGIIIGALGVLNDVTATQVSSVWELKQADPSMTASELFRAGMRIGRDHIGSTVNTLVLAYAGGSLPLLLLISNSGQPWSGAASAETVAEEIVRTLVGSIGLAAAVPITTALAAFFASGDGLTGQEHDPFDDDDPYGDLYEDVYGRRRADDHELGRRSGRMVPPTRAPGYLD